MNKIKVVLIQRICAFYNVPLFQHLASEKDIDLILYYGQPKHRQGSKLRNATNINGFQTKKLFTLHFDIKIKDRIFPVIFNPTTIFHLFRDKPHVIICEGESNLLNNIFIILYAKLSKTPYIWWGLGRVRSTKPSILRKICHPLIRYMLKNAAAILGYSTFAKNFYSSYGVNSDKIFVAYNCVDTDKIKQDIPKYTPLVEKEKEHLGIKNKKIILFVGSFTKEKQIENLILAYKLIKQKINDVALLLVGEGETKKTIEPLVLDLHLDDVILTGEHINDVGLYFLMGDVFVLPGQGGLAINQAMAHGLPIVTVPADGTELDMVINGENGYIVKQDDINVLADKIIQILENDTLRQKMKEKSKELVTQKFNIQNMVNTIKIAVLHALKNF